MKSKEESWHADPWEIEAWVIRLGGIPAETLAHMDRSGNDKNAAHVVKIRPGRYALILEHGCSCYEPSEADIYTYGRASDVLKDFKTLEAVNFAWYEVTFGGNLER